LSNLKIAYPKEQILNDHTSNTNLEVHSNMTLSADKQEHLRWIYNTNLILIQQSGEQSQINLQLFVIFATIIILYFSCSGISAISSSHRQLGLSLRWNRVHNIYFDNKTRICIFDWILGKSQSNSVNSYLCWKDVSMMMPFWLSSTNTLKKTIRTLRLKVLLKHIIA